MEEVRSYGAIPEVKVAVDEHWGVVDYGDPSAMLIAKVDLTVSGKATMHCIDFKTGHWYASHEMQAKIYTGMARGRECYRHSALYLDTPIYSRTWEYDEQQHATNREEVEDLVHVVWNDKHFDPTPGQCCEYCPLNHNNGGSCEEGL